MPNTSYYCRSYYNCFKNCVIDVIGTHTRWSIFFQLHINLLLKIEFYRSSRFTRPNRPCWQSWTCRPNWFYRIARLYWTTRSTRWVQKLAYKVQQWNKDISLITVFTWLVKNTGGITNPSWLVKKRSIFYIQLFTAIICYS